MKAPEHQQKFWDMQERKPGLYELSNSVLLYAIQNWGQTDLDRMRPIVRAAQWVGFKSVELVSNESGWGFWFNQQRDKEFPQFCKDLQSIERGNYERESIQVSEILKEYKERNKWWRRIWR